MPVNCLINPFIFEATGGGSVGAHVYWRVNCTANNGDTFVAVTALQMYTGFDRVNKCVGGTALGGSVFSNVPANAFDNDGTTIWANNSPAAIGYQFSSAIEIVGIMIRARDTEADQLPKDFDIQYSDDNSTWVTAWSVTNETSWLTHEGRWFWRPSYTESYTGTPVHAFRYYQTVFFDNEAAGGAGAGSCEECELRLTTGGADQTGSGTASAGSVNNGFTAAQAFDNSNATFWAGTNTLLINEFLRYDFGSGNNKAIGEMWWRCRSDNSTAATQSPRRAVFQGSDDGTNWSSLWDIYRPSTWNTGDSQAFTDPLYV